MHCTPQRIRPRSVFISDLHLGSAHCQTDALAAFLQAVRPEHLYLVGDVLDFDWMKQRRAHFCGTAAAILDLLRQLPKLGTAVTFIPGNHDRELRRLIGSSLGDIAVRGRVIHRTAAGHRLLVTHGDEFDPQVKRGGFVEHLGEWLYDRLLDIDRLLPRERSAQPSRAARLKHRSATVRAYVERFELAALSAVARRGLDGIICGHIHVPKLKRVNGLLYANDGDWVENRTALVESPSGEISLVRWHDQALVEQSVCAALQPRHPMLWLDGALSPAA